MKKVILIILIIIVFLGGCILLTDTGNDSSKNSKKEEKKIKSEKIEKNDFVSYNDWLDIKDNTLVNSNGEKIQLRGISTHGIQWFSEFANYDVIKTLKEEWNANLFRVAMYTNEGGYLSDKSLANKVEEIVEIAIKLDMYVIIDWHILRDNDPMTNKDSAIEFFDRMSKKYKDYPNVIYEICNEPNGNVSWGNNIKPYAEEVIKTIRNNTKDSIIIVGTSTWSQDVDKAANNPLSDSKTMYAFHFYAGTHKDDFRNRVKNALDKIPIFVSEWGTSSADGNGGVYLDEAQKWVDFMNENNLSWANWSLSDKNESSALLLPNTPSNDISDKYLSESGKFIKENMKK